MRAIYGFLTLVVGCTQEPKDIEVAPNDLGIERLVAAEGQLQGLDTADTVVASLEVHVGQIDDFEDLPELGRIGSEVLIAVRGNAQRFVSRETQLLRLDAGRDANAFLTLPEVAAITLRWPTAIIAVVPTAVPTERAYYMSCPPSHLNTTPVAQQCCESYSSYDANNTIFVAGSGINEGKVIQRFGPMPACTSTTGGACSGADCAYGPNGFSKPIIQTPTTPYPIVLIWDDGETNQYCDWSASPVPEPALFGDVTGTFPTGQGCPGGNSGRTLWDY